MNEQSYLGHTFERLTVVSESRYRSANGGKQYWCECVCGEWLVTRIAALKCGDSQSCGCLWREHFGDGTFNKTHGMSGTAAYRSWAHALQRCKNPLNEKYKYYGGRGIEFRFASFEEFYKELGPRPKCTSVDRKDNDGHYEKGNVRWATVTQQVRNRRGYKAKAAKTCNT